MNTLQTEIQYGQNLLDYLRKKDYSISSPCGGKGVCGKCRVQVLKGEKTLKESYPGVRGISLDQWNDGWRLACKTTMAEELEIEIPDLWNTEANILTSGEYEVTLDPCVHKTYLELAKPSIENQISDLDRLLKALGEVKVSDLTLVQGLPVILRDQSYKITAVLHGNTLIGVEEGDTTDKLYGIAVDIGTTTIAGTLIDLISGDEIGIFSTLNLQKNFGDDVISRINHSIESKDGLEELQKILVDTLNQMFAFFNQKYGIAQKNIYHVNVVGNTVMIHLLAGLPVKAIAISPFIPVTTRLPDIRASELGLSIFPNAVITALPMIAGYIGADTVACILAADMLEKEGYSLMVDIGTNGEIVLGNKDGLLACATAAGPALEGAQIQCGMGGVRGAVNKIAINEEGISYTTIGDQPALGICGSGIVDVAAQMLKIGLVDSYGRMLSAEEAFESLPEALSSRVGEYNGKPSLSISNQELGAANHIFITQKDIREIQLAKAAIAAGIEILMKELQVDFADIQQVYLAGGFGNYIDQTHAMDIGLMPAKLKGKVIPVGNAALTGAKMIVKSAVYKEVAELIREKTKYIELSTRLDFQTVFVDQMEF
ncbi:MAG: ASKHA domain-containing protein [Clostridia bacterium]|nr:ASKHA domain-containing protein [Clostridia bacterium]